MMPRTDKALWFLAWRAETIAASQPAMASSMDLELLYSMVAQNTLIRFA